MKDQELIAVLGGWEGYLVQTVERFEANAQCPVAQVWIDLRRGPGPMVCSGCGVACDRLHDLTDRWVRDLPLWDAETHLCVQRCRVACPRCGPKVEQLSWLSKHARVTQRFAENVARLCRHLSVKHVADFYRLGWDAVKQIDKAYLERTLPEPDLAGVTLLAMDEFAVKKGHRYATIFVEPQSKRVLWVCPGRSREEIRPFFEKLGPDGRRRLEAVAMDMNAAYEAEVKAQCPQAEVVYDLFHVVAKYGREVIDRVRTAEAHRQQHRGERQVLKSSRWLLLRNRQGLKRGDRVKLRELLKVNRRLATTYILRDDLKSLWTYRYPDAAVRFWEEWYLRAIRSRIEPLKRFARQLRKRIDGVISHCRYPLHTSLLEGINNKIKVIKRIAYGFRDQAYFFLKIRQAFPGNAG